MAKGRKSLDSGRLMPVYKYFKEDRVLIAVYMTGSPLLVGVVTERFSIEISLG